MPNPISIPFSRPDIGEAEINAVAETMRSGWLTTGPRSAEFETKFADFLGGDVEAVAVSSATAGMEIALAALDIGVGDEVITTVHTFTATIEAIVRRGARPILVDIDAVTLNLSPALVEAAVTPRTRAILPVHFAGLACDMAALQAVADRHGLLIIEDAAHALPTRHGNRLIGAGTSDAAVFSFYANKTITTGEGGMITFRDPTAAKRSRSLRLHGITRDSFTPAADGGDRWRYEVTEAGIKGNLSDILAAIGIVQLGRAWDMHALRADIARAYDDAFARLPVLLPPSAAEGDIHSNHIYVLRLKSEAPITRNRLSAGLLAEGIQTSMHFIPIHRQPYWRDLLGLSAEAFPMSEEAYQTSLSLPMFPSLTIADRSRVSDCVRSLLS